MLEEKTENRFIRFFQRNRKIFLPFKYFVYLVGIVVIISVIVEISFSTFLKKWPLLEKWPDEHMLTEHHYHSFLDYIGPYNDTKNPCKDRVENPLQVYMYGGSTMVDFVGNYDETIPSYVSMLLCKKGIPVEIQNLGQVGYTNIQEIIHFFLSLKDKQTPDIVIFYDGYNDTLMASKGISEPHARLSFRVFDYYVYLTEERSDFGPHKYLRQFLPHIYYFRSPERSEEIEKVFNFFYGSPFFSSMMEDKKSKYVDMMNSYLRNVSMIKSIEETWDFKSFFYWQPHIIHKIDRLSYEEKNIFKKLASSEVLLNDSEANDIITEFLNSTEEVKDLRALFVDNPDTIFVDQCHINPQGNKIIAEKMVEDIVKYLRNSEKYARGEN